MTTAPRIDVSVSLETSVVTPSGEWTLATLSSSPVSGTPLSLRADCSVVLSGGLIRSVDSFGAMRLLELLSPRTLPEMELIEWSDSHRDLLRLVASALSRREPRAERPGPGFLATIGRASLDLGRTILATVQFLGQTITECARLIRTPRLFRIREFFVQLEHTCVTAVPIICMVTFLIGIVVAYLFASQSQKYGANIFIVESITLAMFRELSPIIVAVVVAGRSGSAFTAHIGTMKLNEEIDALRTLGLSPMQILVVPRVLSLMLAMPLLVFVGDIVGTFGGALIADLQLGITPVTFLERLHYKVPLRSMIVGLVKAPLFALFIAVIGCRMGLAVEQNARSVGLNTTSTVVQSIVAVIILNALCAVVFMELKV